MDAQMKQKRALTEISTGEVRHAVFGAKTLSLLAHVLDQLRSHDSFRESGKILDQSGKRKLAAGFVAFDHKRVQIGTGCI